MHFISYKNHGYFDFDFVIVISIYKLKMSNKCSQKPRQNNTFYGNIVKASVAVITPCIKSPHTNQPVIIVGGTNARFLETTTGLVDVLSPPPNPGDVLVAVNETSAIWAPGGGGAPTNATYITVTPNVFLSDERILASQPAITIADSGPNNNITLDLSNTGVIPGIYPNATVTVDNKGRITTISGSTISNSDLFMAFATGTQNVDVDTDIIWNIQNSSSITFTHILGNPTITINQTGKYKFNIDMTFISFGDGVSPGSIRSHILLNPLGGGVFAPMMGSITCTTIYPIAQLDLHGTQTINYTTNLNATDVIKIESGVISGVGPITTLSEGSRITIERVG